MTLNDLMEGCAILSHYMNPKDVGTTTSEHDQIWIGPMWDGGENGVVYCGPFDKKDEFSGRVMTDEHKKRLGKLHFFLDEEVGRWAFFS